jgi:hypothetical protein
MPINLDFIGVGILLFLIMSVQLLSFVRTVRAIKSHAASLLVSRDNAIQSGDYSLHYEKAHAILLALQKERLISLRQTLWGRLAAKLFSDKFYEIPNK